VIPAVGRSLFGSDMTSVRLRQRLMSAIGMLACLAAHIPRLAAQPPGALGVRDFGAVGDGVTDDTAAFQSALDAAGANGRPVYVPAGSYLFAGHLTVPSGVTLTGTWQGPPSQTTGSVLLATEGAGQEDGPPFITLGGAAGIRGLVVAYPHQQPDVAPPTPYPWTIRGLAEDCQVRDLLLVRPYQAIDFGTFPCSRHIIEGVFGSPLRRGILVDGSVDVGRITNVHFTTFGFTYRGPMDQWKLANGEAFAIGKADWEWITDCFALGYGVGFRFFRGQGGNGKREGVPNYVAIAQSGSDESGTPLIVEDCGVISVSQSVFKGRAIEIRETNTAPVRFAQCSFSPVPGTESLVEALGRGRVSFVDCTFEFWDTLGTLAPALRAGCASLLVQGCEFGTHNRPAYFVGEQLKRQIELTEGLRSAVITGNRLRYGESIANRSPGQVRIEGNVTDDFDLPEFGGGL